MLIDKKDQPQGLVGKLGIRLRRRFFARLTQASFLWGEAGYCRSRYYFKGNCVVHYGLRGSGSRLARYHFVVCGTAWLRRAVARISLPSITKNRATRTRFFVMVGEAGFGPAKSVTTDLQSAPFGRSGIPPGAGDRSRTNNLLITNQLLCH